MFSIEQIPYDPVLFGKRIFTIYHSNVQVDTQALLNLSLEQEFLGLFINLGKTVCYHGGGAVSVTINTNQYNFLFLPKGKYEVTMPIGVHHSMAIAVPLIELRLFQKAFPFLEPLCRKKNTEYTTVRSTCFLLSENMRGDIEKILSIDFQNAYIRAAVTEARAFSLFYDALTNVDFFMAPPKKYLGYQEETIEAAGKYLATHSRQNITIENLVVKFGITKNRLQKGFRSLYGMSVHEYVVEARMEKAKRMLSDPSIAIGSIASAIGYNDVQNFTNAFKKKHGQSPTTFRRLQTDR